MKHPHNTFCLFVTFLQIPITGLHLIQSFRKIEADKIVFHSGLHLACPASVKKLVINTKNEGWEISETEVIDLLVFVQQSCLLEKLWWVPY